MNEIKNALNDFGEQLVNSLKSSLQAAAPGAESLGNNITFSVDETSSGLSFQVALPSYYKYIDGGRRPGKFPPTQVIANWITGKGIRLSSKKVHAPKSKPLSINAETKSLAYLIGRKIAQKGIPATGFYSSVVNENMLSRLNSSLNNALKQDTLSQLSNK